MDPAIPELTETSIACGQVRTLNWDCDGLLDVARGNRRISLDGQVGEGFVYYAYRFDKSVSLRIDEDLYAALYKNHGTKALLLENGQLIREIDRSYYCADSYDYPIALAELPGFGPVVVHCPDEYNRLQIEDFRSGRRLTPRDSVSSDFFHSRLAVSHGGRYLLSAGWMWHPICEARAFDLRNALDDPSTLDSEGIFPSMWPYEVDSAVFADRSHLVVASMRNDDDGADESLPRYQIGVWDLESRAWVARHSIDKPCGTIFARGDWAYSLYGHPKLIHLRTGEIAQRWEHISTGTQQGPIGMDVPLPAVAFDAETFRLAVAVDGGVVVLAPRR